MCSVRIFAKKTYYEPTIVVHDYELLILQNAPVLLLSFTLLQKSDAQSCKYLGIHDLYKL